MDFAEKTGEIVGKTAGQLGLDLLTKRIHGYTIEVTGTIALKELTQQGKPVIVAANHTGPIGKESAAQATSFITPDIIILREQLLNITGRYPEIVSKNDIDWFDEPLKHIFGERVSKRIAEALRPTMARFGRGFLAGANAIGIDRIATKGSITPSFTEAIKQAIELGRVIIFFPEGNWRNAGYDFSQGITIHPGTALFSLMHNVPIVPAYVSCPEIFGPAGEKRYVLLAFGQAILPADFIHNQLEKRQVVSAISQKIGDEITALQQVAFAMEPRQ